jgi:energy-coupling factor transporter ATP-binding protein EcfA2
MQPEVIVLDEPTSFLDPLAAKKIFEVISRLNTQLKITIILVEHRLDLAVRYANRVIVMDNGQIVLSGHPQEVFNLEKARLIGVGIPKAIRLFQLLREDGIELTHVPVTPDETAQLIREVLKA